MADHRQVMLAAMLIAAAAFGSAQEAEGPDTVLAPGDPPLTVALVDRTAGFLEWLLDVPLTEGQRQTIRKGLVEAWQGPEPDDRQGILDLLQIEAQVRELNEVQRIEVREKLQPALIQELRAQPNDQGAQWLLSIYDAGHQPIADGDPPLTRQATDAYAEFVGFMVAEALGQEEFEVPADVKDQFAKILAAEYEKLSAEDRQELVKMPLAWAAVRVLWEQLPDDEKQQYRDQWKASLQSYLPAEAPPAEEQPAPATGQRGGTGSPANPAQAMAMQQYWQTMNNVMRMQADTMRIISSNIGGNMTYTYRY